MPAETEDERTVVNELLELAAVVAASGDSILGVSVPVPEERVVTLAGEVAVAIRALKSDVVPSAP